MEKPRNKENIMKINLPLLQDLTIDDSRSLV